MHGSGSFSARRSPNSHRPLSNLRRCVEFVEECLKVAPQILELHPVVNRPSRPLAPLGVRPHKSSRLERGQVAVDGLVANGKPASDGAAIGTWMLSEELDD